MTQPSKRVEEIVKDFDRDCFNDDGWNMRMYNETKQWLTTTLTQLEQQAVERERERFAQEIEDMWSSLYGIYINNQDLKALVKGIALTTKDNQESV